MSKLITLVVFLLLTAPIKPALSAPEGVVSLGQTYGGDSSITFTYIKEPNTEYIIKNRISYYITEATTNQCGLLTLSLPSSFPAFLEPYTDSVDEQLTAGVTLPNGEGEHTFKWDNRPYTRTTDISPKDLTCAKIAQLSASGVTEFVTVAGKNKVLYWKEGNTLLPTRNYRVTYYPGYTDRYITKKSKSDACGIVKFKQLYNGGPIRPGTKGYIVEPVNTTLLQGSTVVSYAPTDEDFIYSPLTPFCKNGVLYKE